MSEQYQTAWARRPLPQGTPWLDPSKTLFTIVFLLGAYILLHRTNMYPMLSLTELTWNTLVYATPSSLVLAFDRTSDEVAAADEYKQDTYASSRTFAAKSQAMRRILGLDRAGVLFKSSPSKALPGLGNWDNSCYQNSILQGLSSLPSLYTFLVQAQDNAEGVDSWSTTNALRLLIDDLNSSKNTGQQLWTPPALKNMSSWQQQDAQEYYSKVVDDMEKEIEKALKLKPRRDTLGSQVLGLGSLREKRSSSRPTHSAVSSINDEKQPQLPLEEALKRQSTILRNPLEGLLAQRVGCLQCGFVEGLSLIPFNCLTVPLDRQMVCPVEACLDAYTTLEPINGVECANCTLLRSQQQLERLLAAKENTSNESTETAYMLSGSARESVEIRLAAVQEAISASDFSESTIAKKCMIPSKTRVTTTKSRQGVIARAPKALAIHVNRSMFDEATGMLSKNFCSVQFPKTLDLTPWCLGPSGEDTGVETWNTDPSTSMLEGLSEKNPQNVYTLRAAVTHYGRHENGHYIAYRQTPFHASADNQDFENAQWWRLSDVDVSTVSEDEVLAQGGVFMLFYERRDSPPPSPIQEANAQETVVHKTEIITATEEDAEPIETRTEAVVEDLPRIVARDEDSAMLPKLASPPARPDTAPLRSISGDDGDLPGASAAKLDDISTDEDFNNQDYHHPAAAQLKTNLFRSDGTNSHFPQMRTSSGAAAVPEGLNQIGQAAGRVQAV